MKLRKSNRTLKYRITRAVFLGGYITCLVVLAVEAATPGKASAAKSNIVGATIENILNDLNGDTAKIINPTGCAIANSKFDYYVGESTQLIVNTYPADATYQSYTFQSSDNSVATINEVGVINFLKAGNAVITATNTKITSVKANANFTVSNVEVESFTSKINASTKEGVYQLEVSSSYVVENTFTPSNATFKNVTYEYDTSLGYISMVDDTIKILKDSNGDVFDLIVHCGELSNTLKLTTYTASVIEDDIPLVGLKASNVTKYVDQTASFNAPVTYNPTSTSDKYRGYTLASDNPTIVSVNGTKLVPHGVIGNAKITATSTYNPTISTSFYVYIKDRATLTGASIIKYSSEMYVGGSQKLVVQTTPTSNVVLTKSFISSNNSIASVNNSGLVTAKSVGDVTITFRAHDSVHNITLQDSVTIHITEAPVLTVTDIEISAIHGDNPVIYADEATNLQNYYTITKYIGNENTTNKDYGFYVDTETYPGTLSSDKKTFTPNFVGEFTAQLYYVNEASAYIYKEVKFTSLARYAVNYNDTSIANFSMDIGDSVDLSIATTGDYHQTYHVSVSNTDIFDIESDNENIHVFAKKAGNANLTVTPLILVNNVITHQVNRLRSTTNFRINIIN